MAQVATHIEARRRWYAPLVVLASRAIIYVAVPFMPEAACDRLVNRLAKLYTMCWHYRAVDQNGKAADITVKL